MKFSLIVCVLIVLSQLVIGQNTIGLPQVINYGESDYRGGTQTWDIKQDEWGRMYFANNEGLICYDGHYWKLYPQPDRTIVRSIGIEKSRIYAGGQDEIGYYSPDRHGILKYTSLKSLLPSSDNKFTDIWDIEVFNGAVFFRSWDVIFEYRNEKIQAYKAPTGWQFMKQSGGRLIAQDKGKGLFEFLNNSWQPFNAHIEEIHDLELTGIISLNKDSFLVSSLHHGIFVLHRGLLSPFKTGLTGIQIYSFERINDKEFVVGTTSDGCIVIDNSGKIVQKLALTEGLQNNNILCVFLDRDRNVWTGLNNGISLVAYNSAVKYIRPDKANEVSGYSCSIFNDALYIGSSDGAYVVGLPGETEDLSFVKGSFSIVKNSGGQVWRLDQVNHQLMMGHHNGGYRIQGTEAVPLNNSGGHWLFVPTSQVYPSKNVLVGTYSGLQMFEFSGFNFKNSWEVKGPYESRRFLVVDNTNDIWSTHPYRGVNKISLSGDYSTYTTEEFSEKSGLPSVMRNFVFKIRNRVVFATEKGVYEFDSKAGKFSPSAYFLPIFGNMAVQYLNEDNSGNIWFCSGKNIGVVRTEENGAKPVITYFPELTGKFLAGFENIYAYNLENVFIAAKNGIIHLNYKKYIANQPKVDVLLTMAKTVGSVDSLIFGGYFNRRGESLYVQDQISINEFPINLNSFHFEFSSPTFGLQNSIEYSYQLEGFENTWSSWTKKTEKDYTNLASGKYIFRIRARDNLGNLSKEVGYSFKVNPAWYNTIWANLLYIVLVLAIVYLIVFWQKKKFYRQQLKYEEEQQRLKYIHQLEVDKNEKKIIELQNQQLMSEMMYKNKELADANMHLVERSDALVKVKTELQQLYKKTGGNHDVKKTIQLVNDIEKNNSNWEQFAIHFNEINNDVLKKIKTKFPNLTNTDLKVCAYLQLKLSSKEIAQLMNISVKGVELSRYRLRKKLQLTSEQTLNDFLNSIQNT